MRKDLRNKLGIVALTIVGLVQFSLQRCGDGIIDIWQQEECDTVIANPGCIGCQIQGGFTCIGQDGGTSTCYPDECRTRNGGCLGLSGSIAGCTPQPDGNGNNVEDDGCPTLDSEYFCTNVFSTGQPDTVICQKRNEVPVKAIEPELEVCYQFASVFAVTGNLPTYPQDVISETQECSTMNYCRDGVSLSKCSWERKLAVKCYFPTDANNQYVRKPMIEVFTNSMPDHCMQSRNKFPEDNPIRFQVEFNIDPARLPVLDIQRQNDADFYYCLAAWTSDGNLEKRHSYYAKSGVTDGVVGISINGVPIHTGISENQYDPFFPQEFGGHMNPQKLDFDACLGNTDLSSFYKYYSMSPCILPGAQKEAKQAKYCSEINDCRINPLNYTNATIKKAGFAKITYVGIARDGHMIIGPFNSAGHLWQPRDLDACNGLKIDGNYVYAMSMFHPYTVGCWGPATARKKSGQCSANEMFVLSSNANQLYAAFSLVFGVLMMISASIF
eukprot:403365703